MKIRFVKSGITPHGMAPSAEGAALKLIEACGRTAYKSEEKITEDSALSFVLMLKRHGHLSVLEHSNIVLKVRRRGAQEAMDADVSLSEWGGELSGLIKERNAYHRMHLLPDGLAIAGNARSWIETLQQLKKSDTSYYQFLASHLKRFYPHLFDQDEGLEDNFHLNVSLLSENDQLELLREDPVSDLPVFVFRCVCDRGISHEIVRHRVLSFTQESTRYVNYQNKGIAFILPEELEPFHDERQGLARGDPAVERWMERAGRIFEWYREDLNRGLKPQIARDILPNLLKTELFISGRWSGWKHFIQLRDSSRSHPRIRSLARAVGRYFQSLGVG